MLKDICIKHFIKPSLYIKWMGEKKVLFFQENLYTEKLINSILFSLARAMHWCISNLFFGLLSFSRKKIRTNLFNATSRILDNWTNIFSSKREREKNNHFVEEKTDLGCVQLYKCTKLWYGLNKMKAKHIESKWATKKNIFKNPYETNKKCIQSKKAESTLRPIEN